MTTFYGVWIGRTPGIYTTWDDCKKQTDKFPGAKFKKLVATNEQDALKEFQGNQQVSSNAPQKQVNSSMETSSLKKPTEKVLTVDGAANPSQCEYQAVWHPGREKAFASPILKGGTNNIAEFLGLVHAIEYLNENNLPLVIYTDSLTAIAWVRHKKANTTAHQTGKVNPEIIQRIQKAEQFLKNNKELLKSVKIMKWQTQEWGEIPADYGRK